MPWLHRVAAFRDDVIFVILLYQRYIYSVDKSRFNEYGQCGLSKEEYEALEAEKEKEAAAGEKKAIEGSAEGEKKEAEDKPVETKKDQ